MKTFRDVKQAVQGTKQSNDDQKYRTESPSISTGKSKKKDKDNIRENRLNEWTADKMKQSQTKKNNTERGSEKQTHEGELVKIKS